MKKNLLIIVGVLIVTILLGGFFWSRRKEVKPEVGPIPTPEGRLIETPLEERPYVTLTPSKDGHWLTLSIEGIKDGKTLEYELIYNTASGVMQGSTNTVELEGESFYTKEILLGTESRGHYRYDEGVTQGTLTLRFRSDEGVRKFVSDFHLQQADAKLTSIDGNFSFSGKFSPNTFYLTMLTVGLPGEVEREVLGGPYGIFTTGGETIKDGVVTLALTEESPTAKLFSWTGTDWQEENEGFEIDGKVVSAGVDKLTTFVAVASE